MCAGVAYMVQIALSVTLPTVISNLSELQPVPWIQVGNSKASFPIQCIATQSGNSKVRLQTFEPQLMLAYPLCDQSSSSR